MKKFDKKLTLNRETVRNLTHSDLDGVVGGKPEPTCLDSNLTIPTQAGCTLTCPSFPCPMTEGPPCTSGAKICICQTSE